MKLSVACNFDPELCSELSRFPEVREIYGKMDKDIIGGGRSSYTLPSVSRSHLKKTVQSAHRYGIQFNYLLNAATLGGVEQTRKGNRQLRRLLDFLAEAGVDNLTVASPFLLKAIKHDYSEFSVRIGVFAGIDSPQKALQWQEMGADVLCVSAIACNRDFEKLTDIRNAVSVDLQLIVNASCLPDCAYEPTHMNLLSDSSRKGNGNQEYCLDYCFLHCSSERLRDPSNFLRGVWIRPEDLVEYERLGYHYFKIVERSCPTGLLLRRVQAYAGRRFEGNLMEIVGPVAKVKKELGAGRREQWRMIKAFFRPDKVKVSTVLAMKDYAETVIQHAFDMENAPVYMENKDLDGFLQGMPQRNCLRGRCERCEYCSKWAARAVRVNEQFRSEALNKARALQSGCADGSCWL